MESTDDEDDDEFKDKISKFPSSFILNDAIKSERKASFECSKLEEELKDGYSSSEEVIRTKNLMSYLLLRLGKKEKAHQLCRENLEEGPLNIIALANKARFLRHAKRYHEAEEVLGSLEGLKRRQDYDVLFTSAEAEIAYSYSRFGPTFHEKSICLFKKAISLCPERNLWKFGLALTIRRETHFLNSPPRVKGACEENSIKALKLFCEVATSYECTENLRAKAWCEIGQILYKKYKSHQFFSCLPKHLKSLTSEECFLKALEICPHDVYVLQRSGKQFRYFKKIDKSIEYLKRAQNIRETPFNLHHLALSLIRKAEDEQGSFRRNLTFNSSSLRSKFKSGLRLEQNVVTNSLSYDMAKLDISSDQRNSCEPPTPSSSQTYSRSHQNADGCRRGLSFELQCRPNNERQRHQKIHGKTGVKQVSSESNIPLEFQNMPQHRPRGRQGRSFTHQDRSEIKSVRYPGTPSKVAQLCIKSPKKIKITPNCPRLLEAAEYLRRAVAMRQGDFPQALYDLGLVYRKLDLCSQAIEAFTQSYNIRATPKLEKVRDLEQIGLCKLHLYEKRDCSEEQAAIYYSDAKKNLYKAVTLMAGLCASQPQIRNAFNCFPTLRSILVDEKVPGNISATEELAELHSMMGNYKEAISMYEEIKDCLQDKTPAGVLLELMKSYEKMNDFDNAILLLNLMRVSEDSRSYADNKSYITLHILAWEFHVRGNQIETATQYLMDAFTFVRQMTPLKQNIQGIQDDIKAFILCSCDEIPCSTGENIKQHLKSLCDITTSHNTKDCLPGTRRLRFLEESLDHSDFILLIKDCEHTSETTDFFMEIVLNEEKFRSKAMLIGSAGKDPLYRVFKQIPSPDDNGVTIGWLKTLFENILLNVDCK